jgi:hypothetical protein
VNLRKKWFTRNPCKPSGAGYSRKDSKNTAKLYNLDVIISVGYCVKSQRDIQFAKVYRFRYTFVMSNYDRIYEYAADNYGLITSAEARTLGIPNVELVKLAHRKRLNRIGHGVYRVAHYIPTPLDKYADAVALAGAGAYIYGESVLAMHGLALVNPTYITVATPGKLRRNLPPYITSVVRNANDQITYYEGIPSQSVFYAILTCRASVMSARLEDAINEAQKQGLITEREAANARKEISNAH